ncbi:MAG: Crp/Fnr family transcriptional regulator [Xanthomonadaceae bacterium]|nr:Crp/Fnr family transcriptional regulator [Xanthomonadaceae bacterium]
MPTTSNPLLDSLLSGLDEKASQFLSEYGRKRRFQPGEFLAREGDPCEQVYIILDGTASILKEDARHNNNVIAQVSKGAIIGEMGVFMDLRRSASIRANASLLALEFRKEDFVTALLDFPALTVRLMRSLSTKLRSLNERLVDTLQLNHALYLGTRLLEALHTNPDAGDDQPGVPLTLHLEPISRDSGLSRLDLTNALIDLTRNDLVWQLQFKESDRVELRCDPECLRDYLFHMARQT